MGYSIAPGASSTNSNLFEWGRSIFYSPPLKDGRNPNNLLPAPFEKWNQKGLLFVGIFEKKKIRRVQILSAEPPMAKTRHP